MQLIGLPESDREQYNAFVSNHISGSFLQSWEWGAWQEALGRNVARFAIVDEAEAWAGVMQTIEMPLIGSKRYVYVPYGPLVDNFKFQISNFKPLQDEFSRVFPNAIFLRIEPKSETALIFNLESLIKTKNIQPGSTLVVDLRKSEEELLANMHHKTRYNVKVAQKHGVIIKDEFAVTVGHGLYAEEAIELLTQTAKRQHFTTFAPDYYRKLVDHFAIQHRSGSVQLHVYKAEYQGKLLASAIMIDFGKTRTFLYGGSSSECKNVMAPYLMHFTAMLDAKKNGMETYDFWGAESSSGEIPGFVRFKMGFGGKKIEYAGAYDAVWDKLWYTIYGIVRSVNRLMRN